MDLCTLALFCCVVIMAACIVGFVAGIGMYHAKIREEN